jgi:hypothetical protein
MTIEEQLVEKLRHLSPADQRRVLEFAARLEQPSGQRSYRDPRGMLAGLGTDITEADIAEGRREAWAYFPREFPE